MPIQSKPYPNQHECRLLFRYLPKGRLEWNPRPAHWFDSLRACLDWNIANARREAGSIKHGYCRIHMGGGCYFEHRLVWIYHNGGIPSGLEVDHIDGDRENNQLANLRLVSRKTNQMNKAMTARNTSGFTGVCWMKDKGKWLGQVRAQGVTYRLGLFESFDDAKSAVAAKRTELGFTDRHGKLAS